MITVGVSAKTNHKMKNHFNIQITLDTSNLKLDKTGFLAAIPYLAMAIIVQCGGQLADWLRSRWRIETTKVTDLVQDKFFCSNLTVHPVITTRSLKGEEDFHVWGVCRSDYFHVSDSLHSHCHSRYHLFDDCCRIRRFCLVWFQVRTIIFSRLHKIYEHY